MTSEGGEYERISKQSSESGNRADHGGDSGAVLRDTLGRERAAANTAYGEEFNKAAIETIRTAR